MLLRPLELVGVDERKEAGERKAEEESRSVLGPLPTPAAAAAAAAASAAEMSMRRKEKMSVGYSTAP